MKTYPFAPPPQNTLFLSQKPFFLKIEPFKKNLFFLQSPVDSLNVLSTYILLTVSFLFLFRLSEATSSQTSIGDASKVAPKTSASLEFKSFSKLAPLHNGVVQSTSSHARLGGNSSGQKVTLTPNGSSTNGNNNSQDKLRASSAGQIPDRIGSQLSGIYKLAREQTKAASMKRSAYLAAIRRGDQKWEEIDKENETIEMKPIMNNLVQSLPATRSSVTPSPVPIEFANKEEAPQTVGYQARTILRASHKDTQMPLHAKEIKTPAAPSNNEFNVQASFLPDNTPDLREMHTQLVKGKLIAQSYICEKSSNIFNRRNNPLLSYKKPSESTQDPTLRDKEMTSRLKRLRLKNPRKKVVEDSKVIPIGSQLPEDNTEELLKLPKVPYCNTNVLRRVQHVGNPTFKYAKASRAVDRMKQINAEIDRINKVNTLTAGIK